ncbi:unnamed protein product [Owenia fusiformis]|uniref:Uncharacterized protein n=1 Tax=Owenia fusiformis TaxID=6347 RepID=A0A8J1TBG3_OWEFU|nr:unnamed protein product [Owenia fusiformis]
MDVLLSHVTSAPGKDAVTARNLSPINNNTADIMGQGCFDNFHTIACIRNGVMTLFVTVIGLFCVLKIIKLHMNRHPTLHQYIIFYCAAVECAVCGVHWMLGKFAQMDFVMQHLKLTQFLVVSHFYWMLATRVLKRERLTNWVLLPCLTVAYIYFTVVALLGITQVKTTFVECLEPYWIMMSAAEFALVQVFMLAGFYITRRLNEISTLESVRRAQKRDLWSIIGAFELSALFGMVYDIVLQALGDETKGCSGIFNHMQEIYSPVFGTFMVIKFLLPIGVMLVIFHPIESSPQDQEDLLPRSQDGTYTSVFSPPRNERNKYRQMYNPTSDYTVQSAALPPPAGVRRTASMPSMAAQGRSPTISPPGPGLHRTASLLPISEEHSSIQNASQNDVK